MNSGVARWGGPEWMTVVVSQSVDAAAPAHARGLGLQANKAGDRLGGAALGARLEIAAEQDQRHDNGCRLVIDVHRPRRQQAGREGGDE